MRADTVSNDSCVENVLGMSERGRLPTLFGVLHCHATKRGRRACRAAFRSGCVLAVEGDRVVPRGGGSRSHVFSAVYLTV